jgi:hypothetical protein
MRRVVRLWLLLLAATMLSSPALFAQRFAGVRPAIGVNGYSFPHFEAYGGYGTPSFVYPTFAPASGYAPNYWWVSPYPLADPRQDGYNPSAGYEWDSVGVLILSSSPANAGVTLNGVFVGTSDKLGPFQLPTGEHTLRLAAEGYEPSETIVRVDRPGLEELNVRLRPLSVKVQPAPPL